MDAKEFIHKVLTGEIKNRESAEKYLSELVPEPKDPSEKYTRLTPDEQNALTNEDFAEILQNIRLVYSKGRLPEGKKAVSIDFLRSILQQAPNELYGIVVRKFDNKFYEQQPDLEFNNLFKEIPRTNQKTGKTTYDIAQKTWKFLTEYDNIPGFQGRKIIDLGTGKVRADLYGAVIKHLYTAYFNKPSTGMVREDFCSMAQKQHVVEIDPSNFRKKDETNLQYNTVEAFKKYLSMENN